MRLSDQMSRKLLSVTRKEEQKKYLFSSSFFLSLSLSCHSLSSVSSILSYHFMLFLIRIDTPQLSSFSPSLFLSLPLSFSSIFSSSLLLLSWFSSSFFFLFFRVTIHSIMSEKTIFPIFFLLGKFHGSEREKEKKEERKKEERKKEERMKERKKEFLH